MSNRVICRRWWIILESFVAYPCLWLLFGSFPEHFSCSAYSRNSSYCRRIRCLAKNLPRVSFIIWNSILRLICYLSRPVGYKLWFELVLLCTEVSGLLQKFIACTKIKLGCVLLTLFMVTCWLVLSGLRHVSRWSVWTGRKLLSSCPISIKWNSALFLVLKRASCDDV